MDADKPQVTVTHNVQGQGGKYIAHIAGEDSTGILEWELRDTASDGPKSDGPQSDGEVRVATHTLVPRDIGGRGVAGQLVDQLVADARRLGFKIDPQCSYVAKKFDENPDWSNLRA